jgi:prophage regulatory protein
MSSAKPYLPDTGFVRLPVVLAHLGISKTSWYRGIGEGRYPRPVSLGPMTSAWRAEDIHSLIAKIGARTDVAPDGASRKQGRA